MLKNKISKNLNRFADDWTRYIGIGVFVLLMLDLLQNMPAPNDLYAFNTTVYGLNYDFGMGSRLLIGSLLSLFTDYLSATTLYLFIALSLTVLNGLVALGCHYALRNTKGPSQTGIIIVIILYLASPASPGFLFHWENFGRLDTFLFILLLMGVFAFKNKWMALCVPIICLLAIATHQVFFFLYLPGVASIAIYQMIKEPESKIRKLNLLLIVIVSFGSFYYFQSMSPGLYYDSVADVAAAIMSRSDIPIDLNMLKAEYFMEMSGHWEMFVVPNWQIRIISGILSVILLTPIVLSLRLFWKNAYQSCENKGFRKWMWWIWLSPLLTAPIFIMTIDWGRWLAGIFICQFIVLVYVTVDGWKPSIAGINAIQRFYQERSLLFVFLVLYLVSLGRFETVGTLRSVSRFVTLIMGLFQ